MTCPLAYPVGYPLALSKAAASPLVRAVIAEITTRTLLPSCEVSS